MTVVVDGDLKLLRFRENRINESIIDCLILHFRNPQAFEYWSARLFIAPLKLFIARSRASI